MKIYLSTPAIVCCAGLNVNELYEACITGNQNNFSERDYGDGKFPVGLINGDLPEVNLQDLGPPPFAGNTRIIRIINAALVQLAPSEQGRH